LIVDFIAERRTRELRRSVLRPNLPPAAPLPGDERPDAVHIGAVDDDGTVVCTCFVYPDPCPWLPDRTAWHLRQMATVEGRRSQGAGGQVLRAAIGYVAERAELMWLNARQPAIGFYARHGFCPYGEIFTDERHTIPHLHMWRELVPADGNLAPSTMRQNR
jgi:predicted GNAT family N-acyltransferase